MTSEAITRKLVAIVSADVVGYSRLMTTDEVETVRTLTAYRGVMTDIVEKHRGRVVDSPGDNALLDFPSATDAVECAIEIQAAIADRNAAVDPAQKMEYRIGIHLGEVMVEGNRIYGDGVNIAARLEAMADVGGICVSQAIRDQVATKIDVGFTDLGEQTLKNIREPVHTFRIETGAHHKKAILSGTVSDLASMMAQDKEGTLSALKAHRIATDPLVLSHGGRVAHASDTRFLYEFPSPLEAVQCAAEVQAVMAQRNLMAPEGRRMRYQLGIHLGDLHTGDAERASQIQERSDPGGICLSEPIYVQVRDKLQVEFAEAGGLDDNLRLWKLAPPAPNPTKESDLGGPGTLVVLPFERIGSDPEQDYLVDGITDDITMALSEYGEHPVVPRSSAFAFRNSDLNDRDIARQLDATYILKGSVRATRSRVRVSSELFEAESGRLIWTERFDREYDDVLDLQDEIAHSITSNLAPAVRNREVQRSLHRADSIESWDLMQRAKWHYYQATKEDFDEAVDLYQRSINNDSMEGQAFAWLCLVLITRIWHGWSGDVLGDFELIREYATKAVRLNTDNWRAHDALAVYYMFRTQDFDRAILEAEHGERFEPGVLGAAYQRAGNHERAVELSMRDLQINPHRPDRYHWSTNIAGSHYFLGNHAAAVAWADQALQVNEHYLQAIGYKAAALAQMGRVEEAKATLEPFLEHFPGMTAARYRTRFNFKNQSDVDHYMEGLIEAGMPADLPPEATAADPRAAWIAVLPFDNLSGDPEQEYFADGITEDVITGLSAYRSLRVIARTSSFRYRDTELSIPEIAEELGVRFVLEGSVRRAGGRSRVAAQLIKAPDRHHVWADKYDFDLVDVFDVQDQIADSIVAAIDPAIRDAEREHSASARPENLQAWDHVQRGWFEHFRYKKDANRRARGHFRAALELDSLYAQARAGLSWTYSLDVWLFWSDNAEADLQAAYAEAKQAVTLDDRDAVCHEALSLVSYVMGRMEAVVQAADRAVHLNPSRAPSHMMAGAGRIHGGDPEAGIPMVTRALELSPHDPLGNWFYGARAVGHFLLGNYDDAISDSEEAIKIRYGYLFGRVMRTASLVKRGRVEDAREEMQTILEIDPEFTSARLARYADAVRNSLIDALKAAGLEN